MINPTQVQSWSDLTILIPAKDEASTIYRLIVELEEALPDAVKLVVDSSTDDTGKLAEAAGARVIRVPPYGKGYAVREALKRVTTPYVVMVDADNTYPVQAVVSVAALLRSTGLPIVTGRRRWRAKGSMTPTNQLGNWALSLLASILYNFRIRDVCTGLWGFGREVLHGFDLTSNGFTFEVDLFVNARRSNLQIFELPIYYERRTEESCAKLKVSDGFKIGKFLIKHRRSA